MGQRRMGIVVMMLLSTYIKLTKSGLERDYWCDGHDERGMGEEGIGSA